MTRLSARAAPPRAALAILTVAAWLVSASPTAQAPPYPELLPIDEASQRPDFFGFRAHLQAAVARRDWSAVLAVVHPKIRNTFGDDDGIAAFQRIWKAESAAHDLWVELGAVLALGGAFDTSGNFVAPYVFSQWPGRLDAFDHVAVIGSRVRVRRAPRLEADVLAVLSHVILRRPPNGSDQIAPDEAERWTMVVLAGGRTGFISSEYVRSPIDYRAVFSEVDGGWRLMMFIAGD
jgi:hypothetical protein